jgi:hypothetical protein
MIIFGCECPPHFLLDRFLSAWYNRLSLVIRFCLSSSAFFFVAAAAVKPPFSGLCLTEEADL